MRTTKKIRENFCGIQSFSPSKAKDAAELGPLHSATLPGVGGW